MRRTATTLLLAFTILAATAGAQAADPCPVALCIQIDGFAEDPHGNPAPHYTVVAQRNDGYHETTTTDADGHFTLQLPMPLPTDCYAVSGRADQFYANASGGKRVCDTGTLTLKPKFRIHGTGASKVFLGDVTKHIWIPVTVYALSRSNPAPFELDELPYSFAHDHGSTEHGHARSSGVLGDPAVKQIARNVWQHTWSTTIHLPSHIPGFYDMDWGKGYSVFNPMSDARKVWFGYGIATINPSTVVPGSPVTVTGVRLGSQPGTVSVQGIETTVAEWTDTSITFIVPPTAKTGYVVATPPSGVATNPLFLKVGA